MPRTRRLFFLLAVFAGALATCAPASAAPAVLELADGRARSVQDPFAAPDAMPVAPGARAGRSGDGRPSVRAAARRRGPSVRGELRRMLRRGEIDSASHDARRAAYEDAADFARRAPGRRGIEMTGVIGIVDALAARRQLTAARLEPLWLMLARNRRWWSEGPLLSAGTRVTFKGSETLWQYVPGQGLQLHPLANFGRLNGFWQGGSRYEARMAQLLDELLEVGVPRAGGVAWEYYFAFGLSRPPWVSGMAQATALQAIARAATRLERQAEVMPVAEQGLGVFTRRPPEGVRVRPRTGGAHYLLYSGDRRLRVLNGFVQALSGLEEYAALSGSPSARALYETGRRAAAGELRASDTGAWSLYSLGRVSREAPLSYHRLLTGFLTTLCRRTSDALWCERATRFGAYVGEPPSLRVRSRRLRAGRTGRVSFNLSKRSSVTVTVTRGARMLSSRALGTLPYGRHQLTVTPAGRRAGTLTVTLTALDEAGNRGTGAGEVQVLPAPRRRASRR